MSRALTLSLALVLTAALAAPAAGAPKQNPQSPEQSAAYWTPERIKNAKPRERARPGGGGGGKGGGKVSDWTSFTVSPVPYIGADRQNGKLLMTFPDGNYVCSGTAVEAASGVNLVWTAGHCVTDGENAGATNLTFIPAYDNGREPYGRWGFKEYDSTPGWEAQGSDRFTYDVGAIRVERAGMPGATFASTFGTRPIVFGEDPSGDRIAAYGYPAAGKFNGQRQHGCASPFRTWDDNALEEPMQISCNMTGGSSGGGWFLDGNSTSRAEEGEPLISVNSYGYPGEKNTMYGPYMANEGQAEQLYDRLSGKPGDTD